MAGFCKGFGLVHCLILRLARKHDHWCVCIVCTNDIPGEWVSLAVFGGVLQRLRPCTSSKIVFLQESMTIGVLA